MRMIKSLTKLYIGMQNSVYYSSDMQHHVLVIHLKICKKTSTPVAVLIGLKNVLSCVSVVVLTARSP